MATKNQRYNISIQMHNKAILDWHNVNTGVYKAHRNINEKYGYYWDYYDVIRKTDKQIVDTVFNKIHYSTRAVKVFLKHRPNSKNSGIIANFIFQRNGYEIARGINLANSIILDLSSDYFIIPEKIYDKAILEHKKALFNYYLEKGHKIAVDEIDIGNFLVEKVMIEKTIRQGTLPKLDYP